MRVLFAYYGVSCASGMISPSSNEYKSTDWVSRLCNGKNYCSGVVSVSVLGDPFYGCHKDFLAVAECDYGRIIATRVSPEAHGRHFTLQC